MFQLSITCSEIQNQVPNQKRSKLPEPVEVRQRFPRFAALGKLPAREVISPPPLIKKKYIKGFSF